MQTPYFTEGQTEPVDPSKTVRGDDVKPVRGKDEEGKEQGQMYAPMQKEAFNPVEASGQNGGSGSGGFSGVRKILHPAEALDSARHTAELILKDAMDALQRTKQRLMEILPSLMPNHATEAAQAEEVVQEVEDDLLGKAEGVVPHPGGDATDSGAEEQRRPSTVVLTNTASGGLTTNTTTGNYDTSTSSSTSSKTMRLLGLSKL